MIKVGWYSDLPHGEIDAPALRDSVNKLPKYLASQVADYLIKGVVIAETTGARTKDILDSSDKDIGPLATMTDGVLVYPSDLEYFVRHYNAWLPDSVIGHMQRNDWHVPALTDHQLDHVIDEMLSESTSP
jgi:hypothetical protein